MTEFWQTCIEHLSKGLSAAQIKQWLLPLAPIGFNADETEFHISAPSPLKQNWAKQYYASTIQNLIKNSFDTDVKVVVFIHGHPHAATQASGPSSFTPQAMPAHSVVDGITVEIDDGTKTPLPSSQEARHDAAATFSDSPSPRSRQGEVTLPSPLKNSYANTHLNPHLTFENMVVGSSNELALSTAVNVVRHVGQTGYNPLFLYGSTGLGKTHLMHAIGNELFKKGEIKHLRYIHADTYSSEMVQQMRKGAWIDYRMKQFQSLDLLLIDDIQFFKGKKQTQEQFFYLYETMVSHGKQVVISSDTYPRELADIENRLISRFNSGLTIQIEPPKLEMRVAILLKKAENHPQVNLTEEAAFFIAKYIRSNVRELEGALQRVIAFVSFKRESNITVDICKEALKDVVRVASGLISVENIQKTVADFYKIRVSDIYSKSRKGHIVRARHIAMYLAKELTRHSLPDLGKAFGGRDHSTVYHAVDKIAGLRANDRELNYELKVLEQTIKG